jgi:hypothetical protein
VAELGARLRRVLPLVPIFAGHAVGIERSLDELRYLAGVEPAPGGASTDAARATA